MPLEIFEVTANKESPSPDNARINPVHVESAGVEKETELPSESQFFTHAGHVTNECYNATLNRDQDFSCETALAKIASTETLGEDQEDGKLSLKSQYVENSSIHSTPRRLEPINSSDTNAGFARGAIIETTTLAFPARHLPLPDIRSENVDTNKEANTVSVDAVANETTSYNILSERYTPLPAIVKHLGEDLMNSHPLSSSAAVAGIPASDSKCLSPYSGHINNSATNEIYEQVKDSNIGDKRINNKRQILVERLGDVTEQLIEKTSLVDINNSFIRIQDDELDDLMLKVYELRDTLEPLVGELITTREALVQQRDVYKEWRVKCYSADISIAMLEQQAEAQMEAVAKKRRDIAEYTKIADLSSSGQLVNDFRELEQVIKEKKRMNDKLETKLKTYKGERPDVPNFLPMTNNCDSLFLEQGGGDLNSTGNFAKCKIKPHLYKRQTNPVAPCCGVSINKQNVSKQNGTNELMQDARLKFDWASAHVAMGTYDHVTDQHDVTADDMERNIDVCLTDIRSKLVSIKQAVMDKGKARQSAPSTDL